MQTLDAIDLPRKAIAMAAMDGEMKDLFIGEKLSPQNWANFVRKKAEEKKPSRSWHILSS